MFGDGVACVRAMMLIMKIEFDDIIYNHDGHKHYDMKNEKINEGIKKKKVRNSI